MSTLYSHPRVPLVDHLKHVAANCRKIVGGKVLNTGLPPTLLEDLCYLMGAVHDTAKATRYFQAYLANPEAPLTGPKHHAFLSAFVARFGAERLVALYPDLNELERHILPMLAFVAVKRHHGNLGNLEDELLELRLLEDLPLQVDAIPGTAIQEILNEALSPLSISLSWQEFAAYLQDPKLENQFSDFYLEQIEVGEFEGLPPQEKIRYFYLFYLLYSTLLLADKQDVILKSEIEKGAVRTEVFEAYRESNGHTRPQTELNRLKLQAYDQSLEELPGRFSPGQHFYSLTLPTGMGKTLTAMGIGLKIREMLGFANTKLVFAIPFTSIIDQSFEVYARALHAETSNQLLKHHHLAEPVYKVQEEELTPDESQFLIETWDSEVVVTTFVQLLESVFSGDKSRLLKLPQIANSVVFLDEVQNINFELWPLIKAGLKGLAAQYNTYFVFMSATQPLIFHPGSEITELVPEYERYFLHPVFNRTRLINKTAEAISQTDFAEEVIRYAEENPEKDILLILNSKKATLRTFQELAERLKGTNEVFYLSTLITPFERKAIIRKIKDGPRTQRRVIVSTQLIEAGVDISVDTVFRAMAPLDSLIQAAGRANRNNEKAAVSEVFIYEIRELQKVNSMIYGPVLMEKTRQVLNRTTETPETGYLDLIQAYFREIKKQSEIGKNATLKAMTQLAFKNVGEFKLIEEREAVSLFIQLNETARAVWIAFVNLMEDNTLSPFDRKAEFSKIKSTFYDFVINIPKYGGQSERLSLPEHYGFFLWTPESGSDLYSFNAGDFSRNTGFFDEKKVLETF